MSSALSRSVVADEAFPADSARMLRPNLSRARGTHTEEPESALGVALHCHEVARTTGEAALAARALALQGFVSVHRGDLHNGIALAVDAGQQADRSDDLEARAEVAALRALLSFLTGSYVEAVAEAQAAVALADRHGDRELRLFVHRMTCPVFGNLGSDNVREHFEQTLALAADDPRERALSHNDLAMQLAEQGNLASAEGELAHAFGLVRELPNARFAQAVLHITSAELRLAGADPQGALVDSRRGLELLTQEAHPNPYLLAAAIQAQVQGLLALGDLDGAQELGDRTLETLGDRVPRTRSMILTLLADALRQAGRLEEAYTTLAHASELEHDAFRELVELQSGLDRATRETAEARRHSDTLMARNRELTHAHAALERRSGELERVQEQLIDQAERDWLTGLHNRRFLARQLSELDRGRAAGPVSIAILDIDNFKAINDRFGHSVGDRVLVEVARVLEWLQGHDDIVVRSGGEEFIAVMPDTGERAAVTRCEQVRARILQHAWAAIAPGLSVSVSIGVGATTETAHLRSVLEEADGHLYAAKRGGRNRVIAGGLTA
jgi:diguanylate cyclase (GGDEF)-like protein